MDVLAEVQAEHILISNHYHEDISKLLTQALKNKKPFGSSQDVLQMKRRMWKFVVVDFDFTDV